MCYNKLNCFQKVFGADAGGQASPVTESKKGKKKMFEKIRDIVVEQLGVDESQVSMESSFVDDLGADSLDIVELIMALEDQFGIEIPDEDAEKIATVGDAVEYVNSKK